ncbi:MAG: nitroreductase family protein [Tannerellaceae bacterium]|nr:nitroreductase family protein [Tannerellaceae bacterium]
MTLEQAIKSRKSTRSFSGEIPSTDMIMKIVESGVYAPYGGATGIPLTEIRKIFILRQNTAEMTQATEIIHQQIRKNSKRIHTLITILPFMKKKMGVFANRLKGFSQSGIPSLKNAPYLIIIAEKKDSPLLKNNPCPCVGKYVAYSHQSGAWFPINICHRDSIKQ